MLREARRAGCAGHWNRVSSSPLASKHGRSTATGVLAFRTHDSNWDRAWLLPEHPSRARAFVGAPVAGQLVQAVASSEQPNLRVGHGPTCPLARRVERDRAKNVVTSNTRPC